jgi:hypothetical protein
MAGVYYMSSYDSGKEPWTAVRDQVTSPSVTEPSQPFAGFYFRRHFYQNGVSPSQVTLLVFIRVL